jgi:hypothetical protein
MHEAAVTVATLTSEDWHQPSLLHLLLLRPALPAGNWKEQRSYCTCNAEFFTQLDPLYYQLHALAQLHDAVATLYMTAASRAFTAHAYISCRRTAHTLLDWFNCMP